MKNQIDKELLPKINNYEIHINLLTKENKAKEKLINSNNENKNKINMSLNKSLEEIKTLKIEKEQNNKEIQELNKEVNTLKSKMLDKDKEISKLKEEIKSINYDTINKKDEYSNEINILNNKLSTQQNTNDEHIKKIQELNSKIKTMQIDSNKLTEKNSEYLKKILAYKDQISNLTEMNQELKSKNSSIDQKLKDENYKNKTEANTQLNLLSINCDEVANIFNKFQKEIEPIQILINNNKNCNKNIELANLNKLIDEENEDIERQNTEIKKNSEGNGSNKPVEYCIKNINEKIGDSRNKFLSLVNSYYNTLTHINKKIKEKEKLHNSINDLNNNLFKEILPNLQNFEQLVSHYQKKIDKSKSDDEILFYLNRLIGDIINKLKDTTNDQKSEIERLHERVEYFLKQFSNLKKTQEMIVNEERNSHIIELQRKEDEINKMKEKLGVQNKIFEEKNVEYNDLTDQLLNIKEKYKIKENDFDIFIQRAREESTKNDIKDLNYGKHNFSIFFDKVREFAEGLYNYTGMK